MRWRPMSSPLIDQKDKIITREVNAPVEQQDHQRCKINTGPLERETGQRRQQFPGYLINPFPAFPIAQVHVTMDEVKQHQEDDEIVKAKPGADGNTKGLP